jgi:hypothetical protein
MDASTLQLDDKVRDRTEVEARGCAAMLGAVVAIQRRRSRALIEWPNGVTSWHPTRLLLGRDEATP